MLKHYIHCQLAYNPVKGGTVGYTSSLFDAFMQNNASLKIEDIQCCFLFPNIRPNEAISNEILEDVLDDRLKYTQSFTKIQGLDKMLLKQRQNSFKEIVPLTEYAKIDSDHISSIHIHGVYNFFPIYNTLVKKGIESRVIKILTTHNPYQPTMEELPHYVNKAKKPSANNNEMLYYYLNERDKWAFTLADCLFFPSEESLEGYYNLWSDFKNIVKNKPIYFCPTGTKTKNIANDEFSLKKQLGIPQDATILLYLGRFVHVRGYDILIEAAKEILAKNNKIYFLVVGGGGKVPIDSKQWIQIPYTQNPQDYINLSDVCLCPNRGSLFDLSMIEILSLGKPLICSYVGGYKWLENKTSGVIYVIAEDKNSLVEKIYEFINLPQETLIKMSQDNKKLYNEYLDLKSFEKNYSKTIKQIYDDFKINEKIYSLSYCETRLMPKKKSGNIILLSGKNSNIQPRWLKKFYKFKNNPKLFFQDFLTKRFRGEG